MDRWVLVPRTLARFDPELAWTLDYEDAPEPEDADPRLDFSGGALLVPVERWNEHAALEPNLAPVPGRRVLRRGDGYPAAQSRFDRRAELRETKTSGSPSAAASLASSLARRPPLWPRSRSAMSSPSAAWLWSLRHQISGPDVSTGLLLVGAAMLLAWLAGVAGAVPGVRSLASPRSHDGNGRAAGVCHRLTDHPLAILRLGLALQLAGFLALVAIH